MVNLCVFLFFFSFGYLLSGRRPILRLSTRVVLVVMFSLALGYVLAPGDALKQIFAGTTMIANVLFFVFALMDYVEWQRRPLT